MRRRNTKALPLQFHDPAFADFKVEAIAEQDVLSGDPIARRAPLEQAGDGTQVGLRDYSTGRFRRHYEADEVVHVVEGTGGVIDENHRVWTLRPGDTLTFRQGTEALWQIPEYLRLLAITCPARRPPVARRVLQAMGTASVAVAGLTLIGVTTVATVAASMIGS
ncbi:MAG: DUF861 domain-containing protein [Alphaproteobacteria bacterium]|nr:DUF861 domain-containing protein [Alphaproteobacteria bacterium]MCW5743921.1 DUF861 domain-containing protein [Alphaproteobacteria bacterium]